MTEFREFFQSTGLRESDSVHILLPEISLELTSRRHISNSFAGITSDVFYLLLGKLIGKVCKFPRREAENSLAPTDLLITSCLLYTSDAADE